MSATLGQRELFGGAITLSVPQTYADARYVPRLPSSSGGSISGIRPRLTHSDLRQIPDNQEVFLSSSSDTSLVVEILALVEEGQAATDLWQAAK